jgi:hypothetical protein
LALELPFSDRGRKARVQNKIDLITGNNLIVNGYLSA